MNLNLNLTSIKPWAIVGLIVAALILASALMPKPQAGPTPIPTPPIQLPLGTIDGTVTLEGEVMGEAAMGRGIWSFEHSICKGIPVVECPKRPQLPDRERRNRTGDVETWSNQQ